MSAGSTPRSYLLNKFCKLWSSARCVAGSCGLIAAMITDVGDTQTHTHNIILPAFAVLSDFSVNKN